MSSDEIAAVLREAGLTLAYGVDRARLKPTLAQCFVQSAPDPALAGFVRAAQTQRASALKTFAFRMLGRVLSDYEAYGLLRMYRMHLLSTEQWRVLLARDEGPARGALLDIGAGDGGVTHFAQPLFERVCATEQAQPLARVLARRGVQVFDHDLGTAPWPNDERFEVVSLLNVLDRTMYPRTLLGHARAALKADGVFLISMPLPIRAHVHVGPHTVAPQERLPATRDDFEHSANSVLEELLTPAGLSVRRFTRLPYVSHGDSANAIYVLDAALFACVAS